MQTILVLVPKVSLFPLSYESKYTHKVGDLVILIGDSEPEVNDSDIHVKEDDEAVHINI